MPVVYFQILIGHHIVRVSDRVISYAKDERGQYAIITAILSMPLLLAGSAAMDFSSAMSEHKAIKNALDNAVLAAAVDNSVGDTEKMSLAEYAFRENYSGRANVSLVSAASNGRIELSAEGVVPYSIANALGVEGVKVAAKSAAVSSNNNTICVLALAKNADDAITFTGDIKYTSPTCSVHSNSTSGKSILSDSRYMPAAKSFCASGGAIGLFKPYAKGNCQPIEDPYLKTPNASIGPCVDVKKNVKAAIGPKGGDTSTDSTGSDVTFYPGTYCKGLKIDGVNVRFMPGDYVIMGGALEFKNGAQAEADDVTFSLSGDKTRLKIEKGASLRIVAPSKGPRKGIAFMQMASVIDKKNKKETGKKESKLKTNEIKSGGSMSVTGTVYFPTQSIKVSGTDTSLSAVAAATSFIALTVELDGGEGSNMVVNVDHEKAGLPPILPAGEDGAILVE